ncbi:MAG: hypothetical protein HQ506_03025 [Candidatus Marinimicrobia bacterium]|nr:hypothetical protein [Candidatus Neomarinimicrobiota bacterium]
MSKSSTSHEKFNISEIIETYIHLTYCYNLFDEIPILWIILSNRLDPFFVEDVFHQNCYHPILLENMPSIRTLGKLHEATDNDEFTLILTLPTLNAEVNRLRPLRKRQTIYTNDGARASNFVPHVVIAYEAPPEFLVNSCLLCTLTSSELCDLNGLQVDKAQAERFYQNISKSFGIISDPKDYPECSSNSLLSLNILNDVRFIENEISEDNHNHISEMLAEYQANASRILNPDQELLQALLECSKVRTVRVQGDWLSLEKICEYLASNPGSFGNMNQNSLSKFLNRYRLVLDLPRRIRYSESGSKTLQVIRVQRTCVRINFAKLRRLL